MRVIIRIAKKLFTPDLFKVSFFLALFIHIRLISLGNWAIETRDSPIYYQVSLFSLDSYQVKTNNTITTYNEVEEVSLKGNENHDLGNNVPVNKDQDNNSMEVNMKEDIKKGLVVKGEEKVEDVVENKEVSSREQTIDNINSGMEIRLSPGLEEEVKMDETTTDNDVSITNIKVATSISGINDKNETKTSTSIAETKDRVDTNTTTHIPENNDKIESNTTPNISGTNDRIDTNTDKTDNTTNINMTDNTNTDTKTTTTITTSTNRLDLSSGKLEKGITPPGLNLYKKPVYPEKLRRRGIEGRVIIKILLDSKGEVIESLIYESSGYELFDKAGLEAVTGWSFTPAQKDNNKVEAWILVPIVFRLE